MSLIRLISEGVDSGLYHFTYYDKLLSILKSNKINLSVAVGAKSDMKFNKDKIFFLSTARSKSGLLGYASFHQYVRLELDRIALSHNNEIVPVDYWNIKHANDISWGNKNSGIEMEDRMLSHSDVLYPADKYIKAIDINLEGIKDPNTILGINEYAKKLKIPVFYFETKKDFNNGFRHKAKDGIDSGEYKEKINDRENKIFIKHFLLLILEFYPEMEEKFISVIKDNWIKHYNRMIDDGYKDNQLEYIPGLEKERDEINTQSVKDELKRKQQSFRYDMKSGYNLLDIAHSIRTSIQNNARTDSGFYRNNFKLIQQLFKKYKIKSIIELIDILYDKLNN